MLILSTLLRCFLITSLAKGGLLLVALVCLSVCKQHYSKSYTWVAMKLYGVVQVHTMTNLSNFGGDLGP